MDEAFISFFELDSRCLAAGIVAGAVATVAQMILWWMFTDDLPPYTVPRCPFNRGNRHGTSRSTAPLDVRSGGDDRRDCYSYRTFRCIQPDPGVRNSPSAHTGALLAGLVFGLILYVVNMYGMTGMFPWFSEVRDWITVVAHVVFGTSVAAVYKILPENQSA